MLGIVRQVRGKRNRDGLPFFEAHNRRTFVFEDILIAVDPDDKVRSKLLRLEHCAGVAWEASVGVRYHTGMVKMSKDSIPWWVKSKQPSIQIRSWLIGIGTLGGCVSAMLF